MPTIPKLEEQNNQYPDAPPAIDINPGRFGRDAAAMADFGGEVSNFGNKLVQARKQAEDQDAVSKALTDDTIEFSKMEIEEQSAGAGPVNKGWSVRGEEPISRSDNLRKRMTDRFNAQLKAMPSEEAKRKYQQVSENQISETFSRSMKWEARKKAEGYLTGVGERGNKLAIQQLQAPSLDGTIASLKVLKEDIDGNTGTVLSPDSAPGVYNELGANIVKSYVAGLADSSVEMSPEKRIAVLAQGREMLKNPPAELAPFLDAASVQALSNKIDSAEREGKQHDSYREQLEKKALEESRDREQNAILNDIYSGKGSIKNILRSNLDPDKKQQMIGVLNARLKEPKVPSQDNLRKVVERIYSDSDDPRRIYSEDQITKEYIAGNLTWEQKQRALNEFNGRFTSAGQVEGEMKKQLFKQADAMILQKNIMGQVDPVAHQQKAKFTAYVIEELEQAKKEGKPVRELLDASSPKYLGKAIANFQMSPQEQMRVTVSRMKNEAVQKSTKAVTVPPPPKTVMMIDQSGKRFYVPEQNVGKAKARGFKAVESKGRSPQSIGPAQEAEFDPASELENYYGGYNTESEMVDAIVGNKNYSPDQKLEILDEIRRDMQGNDYELSEYDRAQLSEKIEREISIAEEERPKTEAEMKVMEKNKKYLAKLEADSTENEDDLLKLERGKTDEEELAIRERLRKAQSSARKPR